MNERMSIVIGYLSLPLLLPLRISSSQSVPNLFIHSIHHMFIHRLLYDFEQFTIYIIDCMCESGLCY